MIMHPAGKVVIVTIITAVVHLMNGKQGVLNKTNLRPSKPSMMV